MTKQVNSSSILIFAACVTFSLVLSSSVNAQLVFDINAIDESFGQASILDATLLAYGLQPFAVTSALASAEGIEYNAAFSANPVNLPGDDLTGLDVRTWDIGILYISTLTDALNGTPTASITFNPLASLAANGQQLQDLIIQTEGPNGEAHHTFLAVANLGESINNNEHHQITETFDMDTIVTLQNDTTTTLSQFLNANVGETLYVGSIINNASSNGFYEIPLTPNLGLDGVVFSVQVGQQVPAGLAHRLTAIESVLLGDVNLDGAVDFFDISPFIAILTANGFQDEADFDQNDSVNFFDISPFIAALSSQ